MMSKILSHIYNKTITSNQTGITLIEVLIVIVIMMFIFTPAYNAFQVANKSWSFAESNNPKTLEANTAVTHLSKDLREATKPASNTNAVIIENSGQRVIIYKYNPAAIQWEKVIYQIDNKILKRILLTDTDPAAIIATSIPANNNSAWQQIITGVTSTNTFSLTDRRAHIDLEISDTATDARFEPFRVTSSYLIRSREVGSIYGDAVPDDSKPTNVAVVKLELNPSSLTLYWNGDPKTGNLRAITWPANATNQNVTWTSNNSSIASVDNKGKITALKKGSATITAISEDGNYSATCTVSLLTAVTGVTLPSSISVRRNNNVTLTPTIIPADANNKKVTWISSNTSIASIDNSGKVTANRNNTGTTIITVTTDDGGQTATCTVTVTN